MRLLFLIFILLFVGCTTDNIEPVTGPNAPENIAARRDTSTGIIQYLISFQRMEMIYTRCIKIDSADNTMYLVPAEEIYKKDAEGNFIITSKGDTLKEVILRPVKNKERVLQFLPVNETLIAD